MSRVKFVPAQYTALITGAARRIGACIAETLHGRGCNVFLHYNQSSSEVTGLATKLNRARQGSAHIVQASLGDHDAIQRMADRIMPRGFFPPRPAIRPGYSGTN